jgi:hypothetical protein
LNPTETGPRGCFLVELTESGATEEFIETSSIRWLVAHHDCSEVTNLDELRTSLEEACSVARDECGGRPMVMKIALGGVSAVHADLARAGVLDDLLEDLRQEQLQLEPWIWVDALRDSTRPALDIDEIAAEEGLRGDVVRLARALAADSTEAERITEEILAPVIFPLAVRPQLGMTGEETVNRALELCLDLLSREGT